MPVPKKQKTHERFYLLPGQGGKSYYLKQRRLIFWATVVALLFGGVLGAIMYMIARARPH